MKHLLEIAYDWALRCFGYEHMTNEPVRALRVGEEAIELMQACKVNRELAHLLVDQVYDRPVGNVPQEIGGVLMTIYLFCMVFGLRHWGRDPQEYFVHELRRVLGKPPKHFTGRNEEKISSGLDASAGPTVGS